jgi:3',5'-nucleoside bisphosphate phosphatase
LIDLHTHTNESDGSVSPENLVQDALEAGLEALGISDHDTLSGYDLAEPFARAAGLELICGIELSTKYRRKSVHLLGYFLSGPPTNGFRSRLQVMQDSRRDRNRRMIHRLRSLGIEITIEEVEARGRRLAGRPHFAALLVEKGYVSTVKQAFDDYLDESAKGYVQRLEPTLEEGIQWILEAGGLPSLAHPVRLLGKHDVQFDALLEEMCAMGLGGIEVYHHDHSPGDAEMFQAMADRFDLAVTGGSDFHGENKPGVKLGRSSNGTVAIPREVLDRLR